MMRRGVRRAGAGEGNRTLVCSLGSCRSTIELHPRRPGFYSVQDADAIPRIVEARLSRRVMTFDSYRAH